MTPRGKTANSTVILIERKLIDRVGDRQHVAGGDHTGIIINKDALNDQRSVIVAPQLSLEFRVFLVSANTGQHSQESRSLRFWFREWLTDGDKQAHVAQDFFRELVSPKEFPRGKSDTVLSIRNLILLTAPLGYRLCWFHKENHEAAPEGLQRDPGTRSGTTDLRADLSAAFSTT